MIDLNSERLKKLYSGIMKQEIRRNKATGLPERKLTLFQKAKIRALRIAANRIRKGRIERKGMDLFSHRVK
jgi:transcription initiation factor TFIID subunit TAF12